MADTRRSLSSLQTLLADNTSGDISAQDARDFLVSADGENQVQTATFASEPSSSLKGGDIFLPSDSFYLEAYLSSAWKPWGPLFPLTKPVSGDFAWINQGSATISTTNGGVVIVGPNTGSTDSIRLRKKAAPTAPYTITAAFLAQPNAVNQGGDAGLFFRQSSDGKLHAFVIGISGSAPNSGSIASVKYSSPTAFSANYAAKTLAFYTSAAFFMRIADDNTNRICSISADGVTWETFHTVGRTDYLTADEVGFGVNPYVASGTVSMTLLSWKEG